MLIDLNLGNVSIVVAFFSTVAWRWLDRPLGSAAMAVAMSLRPTLGVFLAWWLIRRRWQPLAWALASGIVLILITLPFAGIGSYTDYLTVLRNLGDVTGVAKNADLGSPLLLLGAPAGVATAALLGGYALAVGASLLSLRREAEVSFMVTLGATLLLSPLMWEHYLVSLLLPAAFLAQRGRPRALALPLLAWLPREYLPLLAIAATLLPFPGTQPVRRFLSGRAGSRSRPANRFEADGASRLNPGTLERACRQLHGAGRALHGHDEPGPWPEAASYVDDTPHSCGIWRAHEERVDGKTHEEHVDA